MSDDLKTRLRTTTLHDGEWESGLPLEALARIEELEAKLAKSVAALDKIKRIDNVVGVFFACERTLAELTGEKK